MHGLRDVGREDAFICFGFLTLIQGVYFNNLLLGFVTLSCLLQAIIYEEGYAVCHWVRGSRSS